VLIKAVPIHVFGEILPIIHEYEDLSVEPWQRREEIEADLPSQQRKIPKVAADYFLSRPSKFRGYARNELILCMIVVNEKVPRLDDDR
jgi:hypothetical protein